LKFAWTLILAGILLAACGLPVWGIRRQSPPGQDSWFAQQYGTNGEQIYFTAINQQGENIPYEGGAGVGGMMMQPRLACVSCHGPDGKGGEHWMHMVYMEAPDIRWQAVNNEEGEDHSGSEGEGHQGYTLEMFRQAVVDGQHPDGEPLDRDMPRWKLADSDLQDLYDYLKVLP
jgi:cytochrome c oxidase subunit 2